MKTSRPLGFRFALGFLLIFLGLLADKPVLAAATQPLAPPTTSFDTACGTSVNGIVFDDGNANATQDPLEKGYVGALIKAINPATGKILKKTRTDAMGNYTLSKLGKGKRILTLKLPGGYSKTTPNRKSLVLPPCRTVNFGIKLKTILTADAAPLSAGTTQYLSSISPDGSVFTFSQSTDELNRLVPGSVIAGESSPNAPSGFLRKVDTVSTVGNQVVVTTEPGSLTDAIKQGEAEVSVTATSLSTEGRLPNGITVVKTPTGWSVGYDNVTVGNDQGLPVATVNGSINFSSPTSTVYVNIQNGQLLAADIEGKLDETANLQVQFTAQTTIKGEVNVGPKFGLPEIDFLIGAWPVVVKPYIQMKVGAEIDTSTVATFAITQNGSMAGGAKYDGSNWGLVHKVSIAFDPPTVTASNTGALHGYAGPEFQFLFYTIAGPTASFDFGAEEDITPPQWALYKEFRISVGVTVDFANFLGLKLSVGYDVTLFDFKQFWTSGSVTSTPTPTQTHTPTFTPTPLPSATPTVTIVEYPIPAGSYQPADITASPDGNLWFTAIYNQIGQITTLGDITIFPTLSGGGDRRAYAITADPDGNLWFLEAFGTYGVTGLIGRMTPSGTVTEFGIPSGAIATDITSGPDGNLWFTVSNSIGQLTPAGAITEFPIPTAGSQPQGITAGPDGNLWFCEDGGNKIGRITTLGVITEFMTPTASSNPLNIVTGPDGNLWFTESYVNQIGRITPEGSITEFSTGGGQPADITAGPDGNLWFTEYYTNQIGRITIDGVITAFSVPTTNSYPSGITAGPDGNIWFTEAGGNKIGKVILSASSGQR